MYPFSIFIGALKISGYQILNTLGLILLVAGEVIFLDKDALLKRWQVLVACAVGITAGITGSKITHLVMYAEEYRGMSPGKVWLSAGHAYIGGAAFALLAVYILFKYYKVSFLYAGDYTLPYFGLFRAVGRIGCLLAGCCHGSVSSLPWSCYFGDKFLRHPTQAYMIILTFAIFIAGRLNYKRVRETPGIIFFLSVMMYGIGRFIVEFLRVDSPYILGPFKLSHLVLGLISAYGIVGLWVLYKKYAGQIPIGTALKKYFLNFAVSASATAVVVISILSFLPKANFENEIDFRVTRSGIEKQEPIISPDYKNMAEINAAIKRYKYDNGVYPTQEQGLKALIQKPDTLPVPQNWRGPYIEAKLLLTKEGKQYRYSLDRASDIWSYKIIGPLPEKAAVKKGKGYIVEVEVHHALNLYRFDNGRYPTTEQGLEALITKPRIEPIPQNWKGPYLEGPLKDKKGKYYRYRIEDISGGERYSIYTK